MFRSSGAAAHADDDVAADAQRGRESALLGEDLVVSGQAADVRAEIRIAERNVDDIRAEHTEDKERLHAARSQYHPDARAGETTYVPADHLSTHKKKSYSQKKNDSQQGPRSRARRSTHEED
jgi:hypothetical protein